jgi:hypothetical protein
MKGNFHVRFLGLSGREAARIRGDARFGVAVVVSTESFARSIEPFERSRRRLRRIRTL